MATLIGIDHALPADRFQFSGHMAALGERLSRREIYELYLRYQLLEKRKVPGLRSLACQHHVRDTRFNLLPHREAEGPSSSSSSDSRHHYLSPRSSSTGRRRRRRRPRPRPRPRHRRGDLPQQRSSSPQEDHRIADFPAPKSLAELKAGKLQSPGGERRNPEVDLREGFHTASDGPKKRVEDDGLGGASLPEAWCSASAAVHSPLAAELDYAHNVNDEEEECKPDEAAAAVDVADDDPAEEDQGGDYMECDDMNGVENAGTEEEELLESDDEDEDAFARRIGVFQT